MPPTRREFLRRMSGALAAVAALPRQGAAQAPAPIDDAPAIPREIGFAASLLRARVADPGATSLSSTTPGTAATPGGTGSNGAAALPTTSPPITFRASARTTPATSA